MTASLASSLEPVVRIAGEVAGVEVDAQPRRRDRLVDAQQVLRPRGEAPVVLEREHDTRLLGRGQAGLDRPDAPVEGLVLRVPGERRLVALHLHQVVEGLDGLPAAGVQPHAGAAELRGELDAVLRVIDVLSAASPRRDARSPGGSRASAATARCGRRPSSGRSRRPASRPSSAGAGSRRPRSRGRPPARSPSRSGTSPA